MWTHSERHWLTAALGAIALSLAALLAALMATRLEPPRQPTSAPVQEIAMAASGEECSPDAVALDVLRQDTSMGDPRAAITLVAALLDRYDSAGNSADLAEAVRWMDSGWADGHYQQSGLATRVFEQHCAHDALRRHWLCDHAE